MWRGHSGGDFPHVALPARWNGTGLNFFIPPWFKSQLSLCLNVKEILDPPEPQFFHIFNNNDSIHLQGCCEPLVATLGVGGRIACTLLRDCHYQLHRGEAGHRLQRDTAKQTLGKNAQRQRAKPATFRHFPSKEQALLVGWNVNRPNSVTTVGTGQLVLSIPQTLAPPPPPAGQAQLCSMGYPGLPAMCCGPTVLSSHHVAPGTYSFLSKLREPLGTIPRPRHKLERSGMMWGGGNFHHFQNASESGCSLKPIP